MLGSTNTGTKSLSVIARTDAIYVFAGTITSSPFLRYPISSHALKIKPKPSKPLPTPIACFYPLYVASCFSKVSTRSPSRYQPESITLLAASLSSCSN